MAEPVTGLGETPYAICSTPHGADVRALLTVYQDVLDTVDDLSPIPMVLQKHRGRLHYLPRAKWPVRYLVIRHVRRTLASLNRHYSARAALGRAADGERQDREAVQNFEQSLPPDRHKFYIVLLIVASVVFLQLIIRGFIRAMSAADSPQVREHLSQQLNDTVEKLGAALDPNVASINEALNALLAGRLELLAVLTPSALLAAYIALRPLVPAFRFKRMLFNLAPEPGRWRPSAVARWSDSQATGLYERERRVFAALGARPPKEFPFDLLVSALALSLPVTFCASLLYAAASVRRGLAELPSGFLASLQIMWFIAATCGLILVLARLGWLFRTWLRRQVGRTERYMPFEVQIRGGRAIAKVEKPLGLRLLISLLVVGYLGLSGLTIGGSIGGFYLGYFLFISVVAWAGLLLISLPWWYRINRELRDLDRSYESQKAAIRPLRSLLMMTVGCLLAFPPFGWLAVFVLFLPFIAVFRLGRQIQTAQARAGQRVTALSPRGMAAGLLFAPVLFAYMQNELNKIWAVEGQPLDPWHATASSEANSTVTLPWLKTPHGRTTEPSGACVASMSARSPSNGSSDAAHAYHTRESM